MIKTSKKGVEFTSPVSGRKYLVFKWKDLGDGKIIALSKREVEGNDKIVKKTETIERKESEKLAKRNRQVVNDGSPILSAATTETVETRAETDSRGSSDECIDVQNIKKSLKNIKN